MKKKFLSLVMALVMCLTAVVPAFANEENQRTVIKDDDN